MGPRNQIIRTLVAEDSHTALLSICRFLQFERDFDIIATAADGQQLLHKAALYRPDLVLVELSIPKLSGLEAATELRKAFPKLRIIIFTELNGLPLRDECLRSGADGFVENSQMPGKLMEEVRRLFPNNPVEE
jgi:DNA-binding NarL/FixJ family response regulator